MRILTENTIAIIIDVQERLFPHMLDKEVLENNLNILIKALRILEVPILLTQQYTKGLGATIPSVQSALEAVVSLEKTSFSCCDDQTIMRAVYNHKPKHVLLAGIEAHVCVLQTAIDLLGNGFIPVVIKDCISSRKLSDKKIAINRMSFEGALISSYESIIFELLRYSGTDRFKEISKLVK